jgi:hypothetical protein
MFSAGVDTPLLDAGPPSWVNRAIERYRRVVLGLLEPSAGHLARIFQ